MSVKLQLCVMFAVILKFAAAKDCTPPGHPHLKCDMLTGGKYCDVEWLNNSTNSLLNYNPGAPTELEVDAILYDVDYKGTIYRQFPYLNVTWKAVDDAGFRYTTGFRVKVMYLSGEQVGKEICRVLNMTDATWMDSDHQTRPEFNVLIGSVPSRITCYIEVCSLPMPSSPDRTRPCTSLYRQTLQTQRDPNTLPAALWYTTISLQTIPSDNRVEVVFQPRNDIIVYEIRLLQNETSNDVMPLQDVHKDQPRATFLMPCPGRYKIWLKPKNDGGKLYNRCVCVNSFGNCENECTTTSLQFVISETDIVDPYQLQRCNLSSGLPALPVSTSQEIQTTKFISYSTLDGITTKTTLDGTIAKTLPSTSEEANANAVVPAVLGVLGGLLLLGVATLLYWWRRRSVCSSQDFSKPSPSVYIGPKNNQPKNKNNLLVYVIPTAKRPTTPDVSKQYFEISKTKTVFLVYSDDHECHQNVVIKFANFLRFQCGCDVILDLWSHQDIMCDKTGWLTKSCDRADVVLIINSEGSYKRFHACQDGQVYDKLENQSPTSDMFLSLIKMIRERCFKENAAPCAKYVNVHFSYTPDSFTIPDIPPKFLLMNHIENLFFHIHGIEQYQPGSKYTVEGISDVDYFTNPERNPEGAKLYQAIQEAEKFFTQNKNWFQEMYGKPESINPDRKKIERSSSQDAIDSGVVSIRQDNWEDLQRGCHDNIAAEVDDVSRSRPQVWIPPTELQGKNPEDFVGPASPTPEAFQSPPSYRMAKLLNSQRQQRQGPEVIGGQGHQIPNGHAVTAQEPSICESSPNGWKPPTIPYDPESNSFPRFVPPCGPPYESLQNPEGRQPPYEPLHKFKPPVFKDTDSMTFSEQVRNINESGYDDFDTLVDSGDLDRRSGLFSEDRLSMSSLGGASV